MDDLQRFVDAQDAGDTYRSALGELRAGYKRGHWMWFVFPQIAGLGRSATAQHFAISGMDEAVAYLAHPVLAPRLKESAKVLTDSPETDAVKVFGAVDAQKVQSSMTLFALADPDVPVFQNVLPPVVAGALDEGTTSRV